MSDIITIRLSPSQQIDVAVNRTRYTRNITRLDVIRPYSEKGITTIFASGEAGVEAVYNTTDTDTWPAWLARKYEEARLKGLGIVPGAIVLSGTAYYLVTQVMPRKFRGQEWDHNTKSWGALRDVPNPSPTTTAQVLSRAEVALLFPSEAGK